VRRRGSTIGRAVGLLDYFKRRRERESAVSAADLAAYTDPGQAGSASRREGDGEVAGQPFQAGSELSLGAQVNVGGNVDLGALFGMVVKAMRTGSIQISQAETQTVDMSDTGLREEILGALRAAGYDPEAGPQRIDASAVPGLREDVLKALAEHGIDLSAPGGTRIDAGGSGADEPPDGGPSARR